MEQKRTRYGSNHIKIDTDLRNVFVFNNRFKPETLYFNNSGSTDILLPEGLVLGRITSGPNAGKVTPWTSGASDGSQYPIGCLKDGAWVVYGETYSQSCSVCVAGDIDSNLICTSSVYNSANTDTLNTIVASRELQDWLASVSGGIRLLPVDQNTNFDN